MNRLIAGAVLAAGIMFFITPVWAQQTIASIDPTNLLAAAGQPNAEVGRLWITMNPFYPLASSVTWSISGTNSGGFQVSGTGPGAVLQTRGGGGTAGGTYSDFTITANVGDATQTLSPTVTVKSGAAAACGGGSSIQDAANAAGPGGTVILQACTYSEQTLKPLAKQTFIGVSRDTSIIDGTGVGGGISGNFEPPGSNYVFTSGITWVNTTIQNYNRGISASDCDTNSSSSIYVSDGWMLQNNNVKDNGCAGITSSNSGGGATIANNVVQNNGGIGIVQGYSNSGLITISGNQLVGNCSLVKLTGNCAAVKGYSGTNSLIQNNYFGQNNDTSPIWCDGYCNNTTIQGNTSVSNGTFSHEISSGPYEAKNNFIYETATNQNDINQGIYISSSSGSGNTIANGGANFNINNTLLVHDNNVTVSTGVQTNSIYGGGIVIECAPRGDSECGNNTYFYSNTVTFLGGDLVGGYGAGNFNGGYSNTASQADNPATTHSGTNVSGASAPNAFWVQNTGDRHFYWLNAGGTFATLANGIQSQGEDTNSTIKVGDGRRGATGCTHLGCTGAGIGAGGVPLVGPGSGPTRVVEAAFGGTPRSFTTRIQAEDFDTGGQGLAYSAGDVCNIGIDTAYGSDRLNVYATADADGASNLKVGCNRLGDYHKYTVTLTTAGIYTLSMRVANIETGASYRVVIDGVTATSGIAVPNTGGYNTFAAVTSKQFGLTAGQQVMQIVLDKTGPSGYGGDFNWMQGTLVKAGAIVTKNVDIKVTN